MIDLQQETVVPLTEAPEYLLRHAGHKRSGATLYRWADRGLRGIRLETLQVGGTLCTSLEALQRFCQRLSALRSTPTAANSTAESGHRSPSRGESQ